MPAKKKAATKKKATRGCTVKRTVKGKGGKKVTRRVPSAAKIMSGECLLPKGYKMHKTPSGKHSVVKLKSAKKKTTKRKAATGAKRTTTTKKAHKTKAPAKKRAASPKAAAEAIADVMRASKAKKGGARARPVDQFDEPPMYAPYDMGRAGGYYDVPVDPRYAGAAAYDDFEPRYAGAGFYAPYPADPRMAGAAYGADPYYAAAAAAGYYPQEPVSPRFAGAAAYGYDDQYDGARFGGAADMYDAPSFGGADMYAPDMGGAAHHGSHMVRGYRRADGTVVKAHRARNPKKAHHHGAHKKRKSARKY